MVELNGMTPYLEKQAFEAASRGLVISSRSQVDKGDVSMPISIRQMKKEEGQ